MEGLKQQYICIKEDVVVDRSEMIKDYEFAPDQYVLFEPDELKAVAEQGTQSVDIVAFIPADSIDPIYFDKSYYLAPGKRGERPYKLLMEGMTQSGRVALARWAWKGKSYTAQVRPSHDGIGLVLQQLLYGDEVRAMKDLDIPPVELKKGELDLALMLIEQTARDAYDPTEYQDEVKQRIEAAVEQKVRGQEMSLSAATRRWRASQRDRSNGSSARQFGQGETYRRKAGAERCTPKGPQIGKACRTGKSASEEGIRQKDVSSFTVRDLETKHGVSPRVVTALVREGFVVPQRGAKNEYRFSFDDVIALRMAQDLHAAGISVKQTSRVLKQIQNEKPRTSAGRLRISAHGKEIVVRDGYSLRNVSGQYVLDFEAARRDNVHTLAPKSAKQKPSAEAWFVAALNEE
jgi:DNA end-binding protein Ku